MGLPKFLPDRNSRLVRWGGHALLALALVYCAVAIHSLGAEALLSALTPTAWGVTLTSGLVYAAALGLLAFAWGGMSEGERKLSPVEKIAVYAPGVLAKYIPGSVFQYGSRQLLGARLELAQKTMAKASLVEAGVHVLAALLAAAGLLLGGGAVFLLGLVAVGAGWALVGSDALVRAIGFQIAFFAAFAFLVAWLAGEALGMHAPFRMAGLFMLAWVAGFLVPVAPGGLGVRESALLALAAGDGFTTSVTVFAVLTRLSTSVGDAVFGLSGYLALSVTRSNRHASG